MSEAIDRWLETHDDELISLRRHLHAHPELSGEEHETTRFIVERLERAGLNTRVYASGTGVECDVGGGGGPRLAVRSDIDALGMDDEKDVVYRSAVPGVCHACGHDVHTVVGLGVAEYFAAHPDELPGPMRFIFQPAEERVPGGAIEVIADDALDGVGAVIGLHCDPRLNVGSIGLLAGPITSAADSLEIDLLGPGGHTARPEETVDLLTVAATVIANLPDRARELAGTDELRTVFGMVHGGIAPNVIPTRCHLKVSVRTPDHDVWEKLPIVFDHAVGDVLAGTGADFRLNYVHGVPPVVNDPDLIDLVRAAATAALPEGAVRATTRSWGGDDFAWFTRERPSAYVRLGVHDPASRGPRLDLHAGHFDVDERAIGVGIKMLHAVAHRYFAS